MLGRRLVINGLISGLTLAVIGAILLLTAIKANSLEGGYTFKNTFRSFPYEMVIGLW